jgi:hypothetical protein
MLHMRATLCLVLAALGACASESSCPAEKPSGECDTVNLRCEHNDEQGCPHYYVCWAYHSSRVEWSEYGPPAGGPCSSPGQVCEYSLENDTGHTATVLDSALECAPSGTWKGKSLCPEQPPMDGSPCEHYSLTCVYDRCEGPGWDLHAHCQGTWMVNDLCAKTGG